MAISVGDAVWFIRGDIAQLNADLGRAEASVRSAMGNILDQGRQVGMALTAVGAGITGALGLAVKEAMTFRSGLAEISSLGVKDLQAIEDAVKNVSMQYGTALPDAVNAAYQALSSGVPEESIASFVSQAAEAAIAGVTTLSTAVEFGAAQVNVWGGAVQQYFDQAFVAVKLGVLRFEDLNASIGRLAPTFKAAGLDSQTMFSAVASLTTQGIQCSEAVTGLKAAITNIITPTDKAQKMAQQLGVDFSLTALQTKGLEGFLKELQTATGGNAEKMSQLFGSVEGLNSILALSSQGGMRVYNNALKEMLQAGSATKKAFDEIAAKEPSLAWKILSAQIKVLAVDIGSSLLPALKSIVDIMQPIIKYVISWVQEHQKLTTALTMTAAAIGGLMLALGPVLIALPGLVTLIGAFPAIGAAATAAISGIGIAIAAIGGPITLIIGAIAALGIAIYAFRDKLAPAWEYLTEKFNVFAAAFGEGLFRLYDQADEIWADIVNIFETSANVIVDTVSPLFESAVDYIKTPFVALGDWFQGIWDGVVSVFNWAWEEISTIVDDITSIAADIADTIDESLSNVGDMLGLGASSAPTARAASARNAFGAQAAASMLSASSFSDNRATTNNNTSHTVQVNQYFERMEIRDQRDISTLSQNIAARTSQMLTARGVFIPA